jgi:plasmid stability protein
MIRCMRTTINLDDDLLAEAKQVAARTGRSLTAVVEDALRESLHRRHHTTRRPVELPTFGEGGVRPGVDLDDSAALLELMERDDARPDDAAG